MGSQGGVEAVIQYLRSVKHPPNSHGAAWASGNAVNAQAFTVVSQLPLFVWITALCSNRGVYIARAISLSPVHVCGLDHGCSLPVSYVGAHQGALWLPHSLYLLVTFLPGQCPLLAPLRITVLGWLCC